MKVVHELLFWLHAIVVIIFVFSGLFLPLLAVLGLLVLHRVQYILFGECILSKLQKTVGGLPQSKNYFQFAAEKLFGRVVSVRQTKFFEYILVVIILLISIF